MKMSQFIMECENFEHSKEYFDIYKEACELDLADLWLEQQYFADVTKKEGIFTESYFMEAAADAQKKEVEENSNKKSEGFFKKIFNVVLNAIVRFLTWVGKKLKNLVSKVVYHSNASKEQIQALTSALEKSDLSQFKLVKYLNTPAYKTAIPNIDSEDRAAIQELDEDKKKILLCFAASKYHYSLEEYIKDHGGHPVIDLLAMGKIALTSSNGDQLAFVTKIVDAANMDMKDFTLEIKYWKTFTDLTGKFTDISSIAKNIQNIPATQTNADGTAKQLSEKVQKFVAAIPTTIDFYNGIVNDIAAIDKMVGDVVKAKSEEDQKKKEEPAAESQKAEGESQQ